MPLGNGDIGLNIWTEENNDIVFYISKTDSWSEQHRLLKLGRIRIKILPFINNKIFRQKLDLKRASIFISFGENDEKVEIKLWVDALNPVIHMEASGTFLFKLEVASEIWRKEEREITDKQEMHSGLGHDITHLRLIESADFYVNKSKLLIRNLQLFGIIEMKAQYMNK